MGFVVLFGEEVCRFHEEFNKTGGNECRNTVGLVLGAEGLSLNGLVVSMKNILRSLHLLLCVVTVLMGKRRLLLCFCLVCSELVVPRLVLSCV